MKKFAFPALAFALALGACDSAPEADNTATDVATDTTMTEPMATDTTMADPMATDTTMADPMATDTTTASPTPTDTATPM